MMMKIGIVFGLLLVVGNVAAEEVQLGPYLVSFDLGDIDYTIGTVTTREDQRGYQVYESVLTTFVGVGDPSPLRHLIKDAHTSMVLPEHAMIEVAQTIISIYELPDGYANWDTAYGSATIADIRTTDNRNTTVIESSRGEFITEYFLESDGWNDGMTYGKTLVKITSGANWDTACQLLNTIHVEKQREEA